MVGAVEGAGGGVEEPPPPPHARNVNTAARVRHRMGRWRMMAPLRSSRESISQRIQEILALPDNFAIDDLRILIQ
jgi:hypothetical protein